MRDLRAGEEVLHSDGTSAGSVERIVVDQAANRVTHLVVGDRLVPLARFQDAGPDGLVLDLDAGALTRLPHVDHGHVVPPGEHWKAPSGHALGNFLAIAGALIGQAPYVPPTVGELGLEDVHNITEGSPVWVGNRKLGEVQSVDTSDDGVLTALVLRDGDRVAAAEIVDVIGNNVHLRAGRTT